MGQAKINHRITKCTERISNVDLKAIFIGSYPVSFRSADDDLINVLVVKSVDI